jgi:hypothetical protein
MRFGVAFALMAAAAAAACTFPEYAQQQQLPAESCSEGALDASCPTPSTGVPPIDTPSTETASCSDHLRNQGESDVDCGGRDGCVPCATGQRCESNYDCNMAKCNAGFCLAQSCSDGLQNQDETDVDCGGKTCGSCATKQHCNVDADCDHSACLQGTCQPEGCDDGVKNGDESGKDCGGSCAPCGDFASCTDSSDCQSRSCNTVAHFCLAATCNDGILNGSESSVDCGQGVGCDKCPLAATCNAGADCQSGKCSEDAGLCVPSSPTGAALPTSGWAPTASATYSETTKPDKALDGDVNSHWTSGGSQLPGMWFMVDMLQPQAFFALELVCTSNDDYPRTLRVLSSEDGKTFTTMTGNTAGQKTLRFDYGTARIARYLKFELLQDTGGTWWRIDELRVLK